MEDGGRMNNQSIIDGEEELEPNNKVQLQFDEENLVSETYTISLEIEEMANGSKAKERKCDAAESSRNPCSPNLFHRKTDLSDILNSTSPEMNAHSLKYTSTSGMPLDSEVNKEKSLCSICMLRLDPDRSAAGIAFKENMSTNEINLVCHCDFNVDRTSITSGNNTDLTLLREKLIDLTLTDRMCNDDLFNSNSVFSENSVPNNEQLQSCRSKCDLASDACINTDQISVSNRDNCDDKRVTTQRSDIVGTTNATSVYDIIVPTQLKMSSQVSNQLQDPLNLNYDKGNDFASGFNEISNKENSLKGCIDILQIQSETVEERMKEMQQRQPSISETDTSRSKHESSDKIRPRISIASSRETIGEELALKFKKQNRRRRSFSITRGCWASKRSIISTAIRRIFKWGGNREDSRSRDSREGRNQTVNTLSNNAIVGPPHSIPSRLISNNASGSSSPAKVAFATKVVNKREQQTYKVNKVDARAIPAQNSPSLSIKSMKSSVRNKVSAAKISPAEEIYHANSSNDKQPIVVTTQEYQSEVASSSSGSQSPTSSEEGKSSFVEENRRLQSGLGSGRKKNKPEKDKKVSVGSAKHPGDNLLKLLDKSKSSKAAPGRTSETLASNETRIQHTKTVRARRLMKEFRELTKMYDNTEHPIFSVSLVNDCLYEWKVSIAWNVILYR